MAFLIRTVDLTAGGREIVREREVAQASLTVGRATDNDIHLLDLAIEQHHLRIDPAPGGRLAIRALGTLGFTIDGRSTTEAVCDPREGAEIALGGTLLSLAQTGDAAIEVMIRPLIRSEGLADAKRSFALEAAMPSKRLLSWGLLGAILLAFLAVPVISHLTREKIAPATGRPDAVAFDASWSPGKLSKAHHALENNCESCHVDAFVSVRDETCLSCHKAIGDHAAAPRLAQGRAPFGMGDGLQWAVAESFGKEGPDACTTCHTEHEGPSRMEPASQQFCADCHGTLDQRLTDTKLTNAADFGKAHPEFQPAIFTRPGQAKPVRMSLGDKPREASGLKFPHDLHLAPRGGVARMAIRLGADKGYGAALVCKDCHEATRDKVGFEPIKMEESCGSCHSLVYDKVGSTFRTLRHGDVALMKADLMAMDRTPRRPVVSGRSRPGKYAREGLYYADFGTPRPSLVGVDRALAPGGVCGECHLPAVRGGKADVMPVNLPDRYFLNGGFDHGAHRQEKCTSCHKATTSKASTDLLLPNLASCRECHQGEDAVRAEVPSSCAMCHSYHAPSGPLPKDHPGQLREKVALIGRREP
ncbi:cytochrome c3 family protein [Porphyrobacter sp. LM 6]|uniref:cytochrome c3 family protein n=1 Tax=Porphyrobacter sp. LM 6 TaxID=1896196 RepID=UPI000847211F|nr:cytochrome c3 family protein [Porphyrobacter sp. LM 6]AOL93805.1 Cytochrome c3 [Porphyrobacter sp. LM 6]